MPKSDRIFVMKFLGAALLTLSLIITLLVFLIFRISHYVSTQNSSVKNNQTIVSESSIKEKRASDNSTTAKKQKKSSGDTNAAKADTSDNTNTEKDDDGASDDTDTEENSEESSEDTDRTSDEDSQEEPEENLAENVDVQLLARLINAETGSSSEQAQIAVASVVMNRVNSEKFPDTIFEVIYQRGQYSPTWNGSINKTPSDQAVKSAIYVYQNGSQIPSNVLYQSRYIQGSGVWAHIDGNYFCYE